MRRSVPRRLVPPRSSRGRRAARTGPASQPRRRHTVTSGRRSARVASPMPDTSPSSSTTLKRPLAVRQSRIRCASTGPMPGSPSSCSSVAVLRSTSAPAAPGAVPAEGGAGSGSDVLAAARDHDLLAVDDRPGQVHARRVAGGCHPAGGVHSIRDPCTGRQLDQPGPAHGSRDVHQDDRRRAGRCTRRRRRAVGRAVDRPDAPVAAAVLGEASGLPSTWSRPGARCSCGRATQAVAPVVATATVTTSSRPTSARPLGATATAWTPAGSRSRSATSRTRPGAGPSAGRASGGGCGTHPPIAPGSRRAGSASGAPSTARNRRRVVCASSSASAACRPRRDSGRGGPPPRLLVPVERTPTRRR